MTLEYDVRIDPCDRARSIRDLVTSEAAESERLRTMSPAVVEAMWASGLMVAFNPTTAGGSEPSLTRDDRDLDRDGLAGRLIRVDGHRQPPVVVRRRDVPARRGLRRGLRRATTTASPWAASSPPTARASSSTAGTDSPERGTSARAPATASTSRRASSRWRTARCAGSARASPKLMVALLPRDEVTLHRRLARPGAQGHRLLRLQRRRRRSCRRIGPFRTVHPRTPAAAASPAGRMGMMPVTAAGHAAWALGVAKSMLDDVQELAATKYRMSRRRRIAGQSPDLSEEPRPPRRHVARRAAAGARHVQHRRGRGGRGRRADSDDARRHAGGGRVRHRRGARVRASGPTWRRAPRRSARAAGSSAPSATSTPAPSTRSSARRSPSTPPRCGSESSTTTSGSDGQSKGWCGAVMGSSSAVTMPGWAATT